MLDRMKLIFRGAGLALKHGALIGNVLSAWNQYPGVEDSEALRLWLRPVLQDAWSLALLTKTPIDDAIVFAALRIVDHDRAWAVVHSMVLLGKDGYTFQDGVLIPESTAYQTQLAELNDAAQEALPGCPVLVHAAIGLLLLLLKRR